MTKEFLTTREAAALLGVGTTSVKRWADTGVLRCVKTAGGHRRFPRTAVELLLRGEVGQGRQESDHIVGWVVGLVNQSGPYAITKLRREYEAQGSWWRVVETMSQVLEELGRQWNNGEVSVLQEHLASERLARALAAIAASLPVADQARRVLLLAAEGEEHTLGLSLVEVCLTAVGWRCQWAGRNTPFADVRKLVALREVEMIAVSASINSTNQAVLAEQAARYAALAREFGLGLLLGGQGRWPEQLPYGHRIKTFSDLRRVVENN